jgi:branched-chain amino acid transport system ATP-binding protein
MMLKVSGLRAGYGRIPILGGVTLSVAQGEIVGVLGHNGMGKTTLLKALMGYLPATAGQLLLQDRDITRAAPVMRARSGLGYVPQGREIFSACTTTCAWVACYRRPMSAVPSNAC